MYMSIKGLLAAFLFLLLPLMAHAADLDDLFVAEAAVVDEGSEARNAALGELLAEVLTRVSGNPAIAGQPAAVELLAAAPSLVQQYRYRTVDEAGELRRVLWARFDRQGVERMMRERQLPVWVQRPRVLLWLATERQGRRELFNLDNQPDARSVVTERARALGMPLQLPLMDLEDQAGLTPADVWSDFYSGIRTASARYPHQVVLTARLTAQGGGQWRSTWTLIDRDGGMPFQVSSQDLSATLASGIEQAQRLLAARYAPTPGVVGSSGTLVRFSEVFDLPRYGRLLALLEGIETVSQVALRHTRNDAVMVEVDLRGDVRDLERALESSGQVAAEAAPLRPVTPILLPPPPTAAAELVEQSPVPNLEPEADLYYRLLN